MKFNVYFTLRGSHAKSMDVPNRGNPIEADDLGDVLVRLGKDLPSGPFEVLGIKVVQADDKPKEPDYDVK